MINLRQKLQVIRKGGKMVTEYLSMINLILEVLGIVGEKIIDADVVLATSNGWAWIKICSAGSKYLM